MTLSHFSARLGAIAAASALSATLLFVAPQAHAATNGSYYKIELAQPTAAKPELLRSVFVSCEGTSCRAPRSRRRAKSVGLRQPRQPPSAT